MIRKKMLEIQKLRWADCIECIELCAKSSHRICYQAGCRSCTTSWALIQCHWINTQDYTPESPCFRSGRQGHWTFYELLQFVTNIFDFLHFKCVSWFLAGSLKSIANHSKIPCVVIALKRKNAFLIFASFRLSDLLVDTVSNMQKRLKICF